MSVYIVASIAVSDWEEYGKYQAGFLEIFSRYRGELLAVSDEPRVIEGEWPHPRLVVIEFPSREAAEGWYHSPAYQKLLPLRLGSSVGNFVIVDGPA